MGELGSCCPPAAGEALDYSSGEGGRRGVSGAPRKASGKAEQTYTVLREPAGQRGAWRRGARQRGAWRRGARAGGLLTVDGWRMGADFAFMQSLYYCSLFK